MDMISFEKPVSCSIHARLAIVSYFLENSQDNRVTVNDVRPKEMLNDYFFPTVIFVTRKGAFAKL